MHRASSFSASRRSIRSLPASPSSNTAQAWIWFLWIPLLWTSLLSAGAAAQDPIGSFGNYDVNSPTTGPSFDPGNAIGAVFLADVNADQRADYCRFIGDPSTRRLSCGLAAASGGHDFYLVHPPF